MAFQGVKARSRPGTPRDASNGGHGALSFKNQSDPQGSNSSSSIGGGNSNNAAAAAGRSKKVRSGPRAQAAATSSDSFSRQRATPLASPLLDAYGGESSSSGPFGRGDFASHDRRSSWESMVGRSAGDGPRIDPVWANLAPAYNDADPSSHASGSSSDLARQPLPVRLGLVPAFTPPPGDEEAATPIVAPHRYRSEAGITGARYLDGYYLHKPPPKLRTRQRSASNQTVPSIASDTSIRSQHSSQATPPNEHDDPYSPQAPRRNGSLRRRPGPHTLQPTSRPRGASNGVGGHRSSDAGTGAGDSSTSSGATSHAEQTGSGRWELSDYWNEVEYINEVGGTRRTRTHAYPPDEVPYFFSHDFEAITAELDLHNMAYQVLSQRLSIFPFGDEKPAKVLDIGTGCGAWCVDVAKRWPDTEVVGLDMVPCQTPTSHLKDAKLESRISWVVANFLEELPFPSQSFDMVHMRFLGSCAIREDQWSDFLGEVARVLKPSGQLELIENNWTFLGNVELMHASDLVKMTTGKAAIARAHNQHTLTQPPKKYGAIQDAFDRVLGRRFINPRVTSVLPNAMMNADLRDIRTGVPRILPVLANASDHDQLSKLGSAATEAGNPTTTAAATPATAAPNGQQSDAANWAHRYVTRSQIGSPLQNSGFAPRDLPLVRALMIAGMTDRLWSARHLLWQEAEEEQSSLLAQSVGPQGNGRPRTSSACWAHPWRTHSEFSRDISHFRKDMYGRAGIGGLLKDLLGWTEGNPESIEESRTAEKKRKMSAGIKTTLGIDVDLTTMSDEQLSRTQSDPFLASIPAPEPAGGGAEDGEVTAGEEEDGDGDVEGGVLGETQQGSLRRPKHYVSDASLSTAYSTGATLTATPSSTTLTSPSSGVGLPDVDNDTASKPSSMTPSTSDTFPLSSLHAANGGAAAAAATRLRSQSHSHPEPWRVSPTKPPNAATTTSANKDTLEMLGFAEFAGYLAKVPSYT